MSEKRVHYLGDSEYDTALCGDPVLGGGDLYISKVTCIPCLRKLIDTGKQAEARVTEVHTDAEKRQCECH